MADYKSGTEKRQLFYFIDGLSSCIEDQTVLGGIVGYSIASSLGAYHRNDFPRQPNPHKEIRAVYEGLEILKKECIDSPTEIQPILFNLKEEVNPLLRDYLTNPAAEKPDSNLFTIFLASLSHSNTQLEELLRRHGIEITTQVAKKGNLTYSRNRVLSEDYKLLDFCFRKIQGPIKI